VSNNQNSPHLGASPAGQRWLTRLTGRACPSVPERATLPNYAVPRSRRRRAAAPRRRFPRRAQPWWPARAGAPPLLGQRSQISQVPPSRRCATESSFSLPILQVAACWVKGAPCGHVAYAILRDRLSPTLDPAGRSQGNSRLRERRLGLDDRLLMTLSQIG